MDPKPDASDLQAVSTDSSGFRRVKMISDGARHTRLDPVMSLSPGSLEHILPIDRLSHV